MAEVAGVVSFVAVCVLAGCWLYDRHDERRRKAIHWERRHEFEREAARQEHDVKVMRELGRQMLGTLRPGEAPPVMEEDLTDQRTDDTWFYADDDGVVDPTDQLNPDPLLPDPIDPEATL